MIPVARTQQLLIQKIRGEVLVYDQINHTSHCLSPITATVWQYCNGQYSVKEIAELLEKELPKMRREKINMRGLVYLTLEELEKHQLIKGYIEQPLHSPLNREKM